MIAAAYSIFACVSLVLLWQSDAGSGQFFRNQSVPAHSAGRFSNGSSSVDGSIKAHNETRRQSADDSISRIQNGALSQSQAVKVPIEEGVKILFLGDSMSLSGFGSRLDSQLRKMPGVVEVNTYMACGTNPLSWLKRKPFTYVKTRCGYWSIESTSKNTKPRVVKDVYGMVRGHKPRPHRVPKLEDLIAKHRPNVLIFQNGNNLFGCFKDKRTIMKKRHAQSIRWYVDPFIAEVSKPGTTLKKMYWITPPDAGSVTDEIETFIFKELEKLGGAVATMIDSRKMTSYPYKLMGRDKEHFWGREAHQWADDVFNIIAEDLQAQSLRKVPCLDKSRAQSQGVLTSDSKVDGQRLKLRVRLSKISDTPDPSSFAPYHELLVGYRYKVEKVIEGNFEDDAVLVMHPAYIGLVAQNLKPYVVGKSYDFELRPMDDTSRWAGIRTRDDTDSFELMPYLLAGDELRHPDAKDD